MDSKGEWTDSCSLGTLKACDDLGKDCTKVADKGDTTGTGGKCASAGGAQCVLTLWR